MKELIIFFLLILVGCSYCNDDSDCFKCSGECLADQEVTCADPYGNFKCVCNNGKCEKVETDVECEGDSDCITSGCSGTVCQSINSEPFMTTCEWLPEYGCYKVIDCVCNNGKCGWDKNESFDKCVEDAREATEV